MLRKSKMHKTRENFHSYRNKWSREKMMRVIPDIFCNHRCGTLAVNVIKNVRLYYAPCIRKIIAKSRSCSKCIHQAWNNGDEVRDGKIRRCPSSVYISRFFPRSCSLLLSAKIFLVLDWQFPLTGVLCWQARGAGGLWQSKIHAHVIEEAKFMWQLLTVLCAALAAQLYTLYSTVTKYVWIYVYSYINTRIRVRINIWSQAEHIPRGNLWGALVIAAI